jgi:hypothetical protein
LRAFGVSSETAAKTIHACKATTHAKKTFTTEMIRRDFMFDPTLPFSPDPNTIFHLVRP